MKDVTSYIFVTDLNQAADDVACELTAFMTGCVGADGRGESEARFYAQQTGRAPLPYVLDRVDGGDGNPTPCALWEDDDGNYGNGVAIFMEDDPHASEIDFLRARARLFEKQAQWFGEAGFYVVGFRLVEHAITFRELPLSEESV